jgi:diaminohydroxyphosphoribosylaminopyrimidine deaminase/5-amino-6-(5-phosphoribosylamino)uracil reductase
MFVDVAYAHLYSLCLQGLGVSTPNPNVAAVIYSKAGELIADGFHNKEKSPDHAEIVALKRAGEKARNSTMVVSLEPCAHFGATPPCTQAIIDAGVAKVIFAVKDPNPLASGGAPQLINAGISVEYRESAELSFVQRGWLHKINSGRPLMIWKVATTLDGKVAAVDGTSQWITGEIARADVQAIRAQSDAILVGTNTAIIDNPHLIPRGFSARPVRIVCGEQEVPPNHFIFDDQARTISVKSKELSDLVKILQREKFNQVLIEAGPTFGSALLAYGLVDEIIMYQAPSILGAGRNFVENLGISTLSERIELQRLSIQEIGIDIKTHYEVRRR